MSGRAWLVLAMLLPAVVLERVAYYAFRSVTMLHFAENGATTAAAAKLIGLATSLGYLFALVGGGLAFAVGPRITATVGVLVATLGFVLLATGGSPAVGLFVVSIGSGLVRPCPLAAAVEVFAEQNVGPTGRAIESPRRFAIVATLALVQYAAINVGSMLGPMLAAMVRTTPGPFVLAAVLDGVAVPLLGTGAVLGLLARKAAPGAGVPNVPYRTHAPRPAPDGETRTNALPGVALLAVTMLLFHAAMNLCFSFDAASVHPHQLRWINPVVTVVGSFFLAVLWLVAALARWTLTPLRVWGLGLAIFGVGLLPVALQEEGEGGVVLYALGAAITAVGESAVAPMVATYAALSVRPRGAALVLSVLSLTSWLSYTASSALAPIGALRGVLLVAGAACVVVGALAGVLAPSLHRSLFARTD